MVINYSHIQTIIILISLIVGYTVWTYNAKSHLNRILASIVVCLVLIEISLFLFLRVRDNPKYIYPSIVIGSLGISFFPTSFYTLSLYYPIKRNIKLKILYILYSVAFILSIIIIFTFPKSYAISNAKILNKILHLSFRNLPVFSLVSYSVLTFFTLVLLILAAKNFIICFKCDAIPYEKRTIQLLVIFGIPLAFFLSIVSIINYFFYIPFPWLGFIIIAFTFFIVILVFRFHLIDIRRFLYGVFFYPALIAALVFIYIYLIVRNQKSIAKFFMMPETITFVLEVFILYLIVMSIVRVFRPALTQPLISNAIKPIDIEALESISYATSLRELYKRLKMIFKNYFKINSFVFLIRDESSGLFKLVGTDSTPFKIRESDELIQKLKYFKRGVSIEELLIHLNDRNIIKDIYSEGLDLVVPILKGDQIIGLLFLPKPSIFRRWSYDDIASLNYLRILLPSLIARCKIYETEKEIERHQYRMEQMMVVGEMASDIAHEIRNPLSIIETSIETIMNSQIGEKEKERMLEYIQEETEKINIMLNKLLGLNFSHKPVFKNVDLYDLLNNLKDFLKYKLKDNNITLNLKCDGKIMFNSDPNMLNHIFLNLILNSIEAMKEGGTINIDCKDTGTNIKVYISDTGPGIPDRIRDKIFEPFFTTKHKGSGLGLAVTKKIVESLYGTIQLEPRKRGACFKIAIQKVD